jgi:hypothetical protein
MRARDDGVIARPYRSASSNPDERTNGEALDLTGPSSLSVEEQPSAGRPCAILRTSEMILDATARVVERIGHPPAPPCSFCPERGNPLRPIRHVENVRPAHPLFREQPRHADSARA